MPETDVILASASCARARLLRDAGLEFSAIPAAIDEAAVREAFAGGNLDDPTDVAQILSETKAASVSADHFGSLVIGADQVLIHNDEILAKPATKAEARDQLMRLRGHTHRLASAVACIVDAETVWRFVSVADLTMRDFSNAFLGHYLAAMGDRVTSTVGGYEIEGPGIQLFERIDGDLFTIQGLPLIPLLAFLRDRGVIEK